MSGWSKWGIRRKLFSVILLILAAHIVVLVYMGSALFERFYQSNKVTELKNSAKLIRAAYAENSATVYEEITNIEDKNARVSIFSIGEDGTLESSYQSRPEKQGDMPKWMNQTPENDERIKRFEDEMVARLSATDEGFNIQISIDRHDFRGDNISLSTRLGDDFYLYIETPRGYIKSTADLAVKYTALLSIGILLLGSIVIYFVVGRVTKPIQRIQGVANSISKMDFSERCAVSSGDEISALAASINNMSDVLESSIETLVQANEVLQNDLVRQQESDCLRRRFIADVSHDFKTPLTLMISYAEALMEDEELPARREWCEIIISEGNRLSAMVGRLLELSRLESGVDRAIVSLFCLSELLDGVTRNYRLPAERREISINRRLEDEFIVFADYGKIGRVVTNLLENAVKYTPDGGIITVSARKNGEKCRVEIENTGERIAEDEFDKLFDSFYRADKARTQDVKGYGLGLAVVKVVMEAHGESYGVENTADGVGFWFELALADFQEESEDETS